jgi:hypothetical protein
MSFRFVNVRVSEWLRLFGPFLLVLVLGFLLRLEYPGGWRLSDTVHALADALMVAGIIGSLFEMFSVKFMIERVSEDLAQKLVGRGLPEELQAHIQDITKTDLVLSDYEKRYSLALSDQFAGKMLLNMEISFEVRNYSDVTKSYSPYLAEESFYKPVFSYLEYGVPGRFPFVFDQQALKDKEETTPDDRVVRIRDFPRISVPPLNKGEFVKVLVRLQETMPDEYTDLTHFAKATRAVSLILQEIPKGFDFSAEGEGVVHSPGSQTWQFPGPFVGGQHVRVRWFKKAEK